MNQKKGLPIRYKILLLLTALPLSTLALYLFLAIGIFENDKVAYVFESSSAVARTMSSQVTTELNSTLNSTKPIIQEFISAQAFGPVAKSFFQSDNNMEWIAVFKKIPESGFKPIAKIERADGEFDSNLQNLRNVEDLLRQTQAAGRIVNVPFNDDRVIIFERIGEAGAVDESIIAVLARMKDMRENFRSPSSSEVFLVSPNADVLFGPAGSAVKSMNEKINLDFLQRAREQKFSTGTEEIVDSAGEPMLASFSRVGFGDLFVVSLVPKNEALKAVEVLIRKSLIFFVLLISGTGIFSLIASGSLTSALTDLFQATKQIAEGKFDIRVKVKSNDEIGSLADSFNAMAGEVSRLMMETAEKSRMESELKTAQTVQETLFPPTEAQIGNFHIAGYYEPASECGGDWWHYCQVGERVFVWIGDATGHGAPAALITSAAKSAATIIERLNVEPAKALELLNYAICDVSKGKIMMTFFLGCFDLKTQEFAYANASHEGPYLIKKSDSPLKKKDLIPLNEVNNPRLGQARDSQYQQVSLKLDAGDRILFYTDGIPDIEDPQKNPWGEREFIKAIIATNKDYPPVKESTDNLVSLFQSYRQKAPLKDDITFFMCEWLG